MLFRVLSLATSILIAVGLITQILIPVLYDRPILFLFRKASRIARAERLRSAARSRKEAAMREAEAVRTDLEAGRLDDALLDELTREQTKGRK